MITKLALRMLKEVDLRLLIKFIYNFGFKNLIAISKFKKRIKKGNNFPAFIMLSITNRCNLACQGCWVNTNKPYYDLSLSTLNNIINESKKNSSYFFGLLGGEPLLHPELFDVIKSHPDCYFQVFTNGTLLTDEIAKKFKKFGNVTPVISIEGLDEVSDERRGGKNVFQDSINGLKYCIKNRLITGVAASICRSNYNDFVNIEYISKLIDMGVHYLWYYIYRPVGENPAKELILTGKQIIDLRKFIVDARKKAPIGIVDTYWDDKGNALCPAATGLSHHISPNGYIEFCPPLQFACDKIEDGSKIFDIINDSQFLKRFRELTSSISRGCILMENPDILYDFLKRENAVDSSGRNNAYNEIKSMCACLSHNIKGMEIPEKHWAYKFAKKNWFFGFGAYG